MKKSFKNILLCLFIIIFMSGCSKSYNSSPDKVALEMAKRLSSGNYKNIEELIIYDKSKYLDSQSFENYLKENDLNIKGNKKYEVEKVNVDKDDNNKTIRIKIDDNKILRINTIKENNKWYVDLGASNYDEDFSIQVPTGSEVFLNGNKLEFNKYGTKETINKSIYYNDSYYYDVVYDTYTIPNILTSKYNLTVKNSEANTLKETIYSDKTYYDNYMANKDKNIFSDENAYFVTLSLKDESQKNIEEYIEACINSILKNVNDNKSFDSIKKYFQDIKDSDLTKIESSYNKLLKKKEDIGSYSETLLSEFSLEEIDYQNEPKISYYGNDVIIAIFDYKFKYRSIFNYTNFMKSFNDTFHKDEYIERTNKVILHLKKNKDNKYSIVNVKNIIPLS